MVPIRAWCGVVAWAHDGRGRACEADHLKQAEIDIDTGVFRIDSFKIQIRVGQMLGRRIQ
jgi:hypothetical protein